MTTSFKQEKTFSERQETSEKIRSRYPDKIPVIVEKRRGERMLGDLANRQIMIGENQSMAYFISVIRQRLKMTSSTAAIFVLVDGNMMVHAGATLAHVYRRHRDEDGFLYVTYASEDTFG